MFIYQLLNECSYLLSQSQAYNNSKTRSKAIPREPLISMEWFLIGLTFNDAFKSSKVLLRFILGELNVEA